jgi:hypothetical protein
MSEIIRNYKKALKLNNEQLQLEILENFGIKSIITRNENRLYIGVSHYESCFTLMRKLRWDFDYCVHKKGEIYIIDISNSEVENFEENRRLNRSVETVFDVSNFKTTKVKTASLLFDNSNAHLINK